MIPKLSAVHITSNGEQIRLLQDTILVQLPKGRRVLSSSWNGGGYRTDLKAVYNHQIPHRPGKGYTLDGRSMKTIMPHSHPGSGFPPTNAQGCLPLRP